MTGNPACLDLRFNEPSSLTLLKTTVLPILGSTTTVSLYSDNGRNQSHHLLQHRLNKQALFLYDYLFHHKIFYIFLYHFCCKHHNDIYILHFHYNGLLGNFQSNDSRILFFFTIFLAIFKVSG